jgi:hypothetical protein
MSFLADPIGNISGALHKVDKSPLGKALEGAALMAVAPELMGTMGGYFGGSAALGSALTVGGIAGLSSGNLAQGLMAGLSAYGGASMMGEPVPAGGPAPVVDKMGASVNAADVPRGFGEVAKAAEAGTTVAPSSVSQFTVPSNISPTELGQAGLDRTYDVSNLTNATATPMPATPTTGIQSLDAASYDKMWGPGGTELGAKTITPTDVMNTSGITGKAQAAWELAKANPKTAMALAGLAALPMLTKQQGVNVPKQANTRFVRNYNYNPFGGYSGQGVMATAATGGLVALADGGIAHFDGSDGSAVTAPTYSNEQIQNYIQGIQAANPGNQTAQDQQIAAAMNQFHVDPGQLAGALNMNVGDVQSRYNAAAPTGGYATGASGVSNNAINQWLGQNPTASDATIYNAMQQYGVTPQQMAAATGNPLAGEGNIMDRYGLAQDIIGQGNIVKAAPANNLLGSSYDQQWAAYMDAHKNASGVVDPIAVKEMARTTGIPETEIAARYAAAEAKLHPPVVKDTTKTNTSPLAALPVPINLADAATITKMPGVSGTTGAGILGGGTVVNPNGTVTTSPVIPGMPQGGFTGMQQLVDAYTKGGGNTGYVSPVVKDMTEHAAQYDTQTGGSRAAYDYLMGKSPNPLTPYTPTGEISKPYLSSVMGKPMGAAYTVSQPMIFDPVTRSYKANPNYDASFSATKDYLQTPQTGITENTAKMLGYTALPNGIYGVLNADGTYTGIDGKTYDASGVVVPPKTAANGGLMALAGGGMSVGNLGGYSDGGRLLRGPGDGISDSIPATIGADNPQPARLADGEFVVPARIVSELGNGSTEAGARKLYQMMDRVQNARKKTTGKKQVAANANAQQYLPA